MSRIVVLAIAIVLLFVFFCDCNFVRKVIIFGNAF